MKISLSRGMFAIIDDKDAELVLKYKWCAKQCGKNYYVYNRKNGYLHRFLMDAKKGDMIDHVDRDPLNNSRSNLRLSSHRLNSQNRGPNKNNACGFKGVYMDDYNRSKYKAQIKNKGKLIHIGWFYDSIDAAKAYDTKAKKLFENPYLNFPD